MEEFARRCPGQLLTMAMSEIEKVVTDRDGPASSASELPTGKFLQYFLTVLLPRHGAERIGLRNMREIRTLCTGLDLLVEGRLAFLGDLMVQRLKALEIAICDGQWSVAQHHELIPPTDSGLVGPNERAQAAKSELERLRIAEAVTRAGPRR